MITTAPIPVLRSRRNAIKQHPLCIKKAADLQFEQDWQNAISGEELVQHVHRHIEALYAGTTHH